MDKPAVVAVLKEMGSILEITGANAFEVMAYQHGADNLEDWEGDLPAAVEEGTLTELPGIGKGLSKVISDLVRTGRSEDHEELQGKIPMSLLELLAVQGLGARKIQRLHGELGITSLDELETAAQEQRIRALKGFGAKSEERILTGIEKARKYGRR